MQYTVYNFEIESGEPSLLWDILVSALADLGFDSFVEEDGLYKAYIPQEEAPLEEELDLILQDLPLEDYEISWWSEELPEENWNEEWEKNYFEPLSLSGGALQIRAPFHPKGEVAEVELLISPKMAFGTGNHATTALMAERLFRHRPQGVEVLDMGTGTGILGLLALKLGAAAVTMIDIDHWSIENALENAQLNALKPKAIIEGDSSVIPNEEYDLILANIIRSVLLEDMPCYVQHLRAGGELWLSGILKEDASLLLDKAASLGLSLVEIEEQGDWILIALRK